MNKFFCLLVVFGFFLLDIQSNDVEFIGVEFLNGSSVVKEHNISVLKIYETNVSTYTLYATIETMVELNDDYQIDFMFHYKRFQSGHYRRTRISMQKESLCNVIKNYLTPMFPPSKKNTSNLADLKTFCPLKKVGSNFFLKSNK